MSKRKITNPFNLKFEPFDNYGAAIHGMNWHIISYNAYFHYALGRFHE